MALTDLVNLVDHEDRVLALKALHLFNEDTWLTINIGPFGSFDVHRIVLPTHRDNRGRSLETLTNTLGNRGLTNSRRSRQQQNHALLRVDTFILSNEL